MPHLFDDYDPEAVPYHSIPEGAPTVRIKRIYPEQQAPVRPSRPPGSLVDLDAPDRILDLADRDDQGSKPTPAG